MSHSLCPFWMGYLLLCPFRLWGQNPNKLLTPYLSSGMTVLEVGPGMGFFTLPMARMMSPAGKVVSVDTQEKMLAAVRRRAAAEGGLAERIETRHCQQTTLAVSDLAGKVDFVLLFAVAHEVPDLPRLFSEIAQVMKPGARCLLAEPRFHVSVREFDRMLAAARQWGLQTADRPRIRASRTALLVLGNP